MHTGRLDFFISFLCTDLEMIDKVIFIKEYVDEMLANLSIRAINHRFKLRPLLRYKHSRHVMDSAIDHVSRSFYSEFTN